MNPASAPRWPRRIILLAFTLSGVSGLIYELVWMRRLTLIFGSTTLAASTVLAALMGGLALGSYLLGRVADRRTETALFTYGLGQALRAAGRRAESIAELRRAAALSPQDGMLQRGSISGVTAPARRR